MNHNTYKIGMISLGCPKNQVDAEQMLGLLSSAGFEITPDQNEADVIVVNTCGFIGPAKEESIEAVLEAARAKKEGSCRAVVIAGCLAQRYREGLLEEIPEADAIVGISEIRRIAEVCMDALAGRGGVARVSSPDFVYGLPRVCTTPRHVRYLKIAEGCSNRCSYCAIPLIRGPFKARPAETILEEAKRLVDEGAREIILLAQDSTAYKDGDIDLPRLMRMLVRIEGIEWLRLMYAYPGRISEGLMQVMAGEEKVCRYLDIPVQHIDDDLLRAMNRRSTADDIRRGIERLRRHVPGIALRTSLIVGFPGETEAAFKRLLRFVKDTEFDRLGVFTYSPEEGTPARNLAGPVSAEVAEERRGRIMEVQAAISLRKNRALVGSRQRVLVDGMEDLVLMGRLVTQAPDIDGAVYLSECDAAPGDFVEVVITDASEYDLKGTPCRR